MLTIGLDVHKRETQACVVDERGNVVAEKRFRTRSASFKRALADYRGAPVVLESLGFHRPVARWLEQDHEVHLAHPRRIPKPSVKTDRVDAEHLAQLLRVNLLPEAWLPPETMQLQRDLVRHRQFLGQEVRRLKTKIKHDLYKHGHFVEENPTETKKGREWLHKLAIPETTSSLNILEQVEEEQRLYDSKIEELAKENKDAQLLMTIPGVGAYTAMIVLAEVGDFHRFTHKDQLGAYAGLAVRQNQSGDHDRRGSITKEGSRLLRWILIEAARNHVRYCPDSDLSNRHKQLAQRRGAKKAEVATARVLLTIMYTMIKNNESFRVNR